VAPDVTGSMSDASERVDPYAIGHSRIDVVS